MTTKAPAATEPSDEQALVLSAREGGARAFEELYERYSQRIYNLVVRSVRDPQLAADVCQEVWLKAHQQLPKLRDAGAFSSWIFRIASRACVDSARKRTSDPQLVELLDDRPDTSAGPEDETLQHDEARLTWEALGAVPERQHIALFLREVEGKSYQEIAQIMDTSVSAVETLLFRARRSVAEAFDRLQAATEERCSQARKSIAGLLDGEATPVQQRAIAAHVEQCRPCLGELTQARRASAAYAALPLLAVPGFLGERVLEALAAAGAAAQAGAATGSAVTYLGLAAAKAKLALTAVALTAGIATVAVVAPQDASEAQLSAAASSPAAAQPESPAGVADAIEDIADGLPAIDLVAAIEEGLLDEEAATEIIESLTEGALQDVQDTIDVVTDAAEDLGVDLPADVEAPLPTVEAELPELPDADLTVPVPTAVPEVPEAELPLPEATVELEPTVPGLP